MKNGLPVWIGAVVVIGIVSFVIAGDTLNNTRIESLSVKIDTNVSAISINHLQEMIELTELRGRQQRIEDKLNIILRYIEKENGVRYNESVDETNNKADTLK